MQKNSYSCEVLRMVLYLSQSADASLRATCYLWPNAGLFALGGRDKR